MKHIKTYYEILELPEGASAEEIKRAFRNLVKEWHPDLHPEKADAAEKTQELNEAYSVLSDPDKRLQYDEYLSYIRMDNNPFQKEAVVPDSEPSTEADETYYSNMSFKDYVENVANGSYKAYEDAFDGEVHVFDEEGYREYKKNEKYKDNVFDKEVSRPGMILIPFGIMMFAYIFFTNKKAFSANSSSSFSVPIWPIILVIAGAIGAVIIIKGRKKAAEKAAEKKMSGIDSLAEADKWFDVWLYPEKPLSECRKAFFTFSVRADKHILSRFSRLSPEEQEKYADIIELLKETIDYRERQ